MPPVAGGLGGSVGVGLGVGVDGSGVGVGVTGGLGGSDGLGVGVGVTGASSANRLSIRSNLQASYAFSFAVEFIGAV